MKSLVLILPLLSLGGILEDPLLTFKPEDVRATAEYMIQFTTASAVQSNSIIKVTFPSQFTVQDSSSHSCSVSVFFASVSSVSCEASSNVITVQSAFSQTSFLEGGQIIQMTFQDITNPSSSSKSSSIGVSVFQSDGITLIDSLASSEFYQVTAVPASFSTASISTQSDVIGASTSWTFTFTPTYSVPSNSLILITFPYQNEYVGASGQNLEEFLVSSTPTCEGIEQMNVILTCSYSNFVLAVSGGFDTEVSGQISFKSDSILNPPSPTSVTGFKVQIADSAGGIYEQSSNTISVKVSTPGQLYNLSITPSPRTVSTASTYLVRFAVDNFLYSGCKVRMTIPSQITFDSQITVQGLSAIAQGQRAFEILDGDTITITDGYTQYTASNNHYFQVSFFTNPISTQTTPEFFFQTLTSTDQVIDEGNGGTVTATTGSISQYDGNDFVVAEDYTVGVVTTYTFDFQTEHSIDQGGYLSVTFPGEIEVIDRDNTTPCTNTLAGLHADAKCEVIGQNLVIYDGFPTGLSAGRISFSLDQVQNSFSTAETSSFFIQTHPEAGLAYEIDSVTDGVTITAVPAPLKSVSVSMASQVTGAVTTYTFEIQTSTTVTAGGYLFVTFPTGVQITDTQQADNSCSKLQGFSTTSFYCSTTSNTIQVFGFDSGNFSPGILEFEIQYVQNPPSTKKYQSFQIATYDQDGNKIDQTNSGISVQPSQANNLMTGTATASSSVNGQQNTYTFTFKVKNTTPESFKVKIVPPSQISFSSSPVCGTSGIVTSIICSIVQSTNLQAQITLSQQITQGTQVSFTVDSVTNPPLTQQTDSFQFYTYTSDDYEIDQKLTGITTQTDTAAPIVDIIISADSSLITAQTSYTVDYIPINPHPTGSSISITIPNQFQIGTISCSSDSLDPGLSCSLSGRTVQTSGGFTSEITSPTRIVLSISGITNPSQMDATEPWVVLSRSGTFLIDTSTDTVSTFTCQSPCFTCANSPSFCLSCDSEGVTPYYYDDTCNAQCLDGQTDLLQTEQTVCIPCQDPCLYCSDYTTFCTQCDVSSGFPYLFDDTCNSDCQEGKYGTGTSCVSCVNPCLNCSDASTCLSCTTRISDGAVTYLDGTNCVDTCPDGTLANDDTLVCDQCSEDCVTCTGTTDYCDSCDQSSDLKLLQGACIASCPDDGRYIQIDGVCQRCTGDCDTCQTDLNSCTSCLNDKFLYGSICQDECPNGTVTVGFKCRSCQSPCDTCTGGTTTCVTCIQGYLLQGTECLSECSDGYLSDGVNCNQCDQNCLTCQSQASQCTSCYIGTYLYDQQCVDSCPTDYYVHGDKVCDSCDNNCLTCSGVTTYCTSCIGGKVLYNNVCQDSCPAGTTIQVDQVCYECSDNCLTCTGDINTCQTCEAGQLLQQGTCVDSCSGGYLEDGSNCQACNEACFTCSGNTSTCTSCPSNTYLYEDLCRDSCPEGWMPDSGECVQIEDSLTCAPGCQEDMLLNTSCQSECNVQACAYDNGMCNKGETNCADGEYQQGDECFDCQSPCDLCEAPAYCLSCEIDSGTGELKLLYDNNCYSTCPEGTVKISDLACSDCDFGCLECVGDTSTCTECESGYKLYNNQCITQCISGTTIQSDDGFSCADCSTNCNQCQTTIDNCVSCDQGKVLQDGTCKNQCDSGYTTTTNSPSTCRACDGCLECSGQITTCIACQGSDFLYSQECVTQCPVGTYTSGSRCIDCQQACISCTGTNNCQVCTDEYVKHETLCLEVCPSGYQAVNGNCQVIILSENCATDCTNQLLENSTCEDQCNLQVCNFDNQACLHSGECPAGEFFTGQTCQSCQYPCKTCNSTLTCTSCDPHVTTSQTMLLYDDYCYQTCPEGTLKSSPYCLDCDPVCKTCASDVSTCISCQDGEFLYNGTCESSCPQDTSVQLGSICQDCDSDCATCSGTFDTCTSCADDKVLQGTECKFQCDQGYTTTSIFPSTCRECTGDCDTCTDETYFCTSCKNDKYLYEGVCYSQCPSGVTVLLGDTCVECESPCAKCSTSTTTCTTCENGYYLFISTCEVTCPTGYQATLGECTPYCSEGCTNDLLNNQVCDVACNSQECAYDNGMCQQDTQCELGTYRDGTECVDCVQPCNTCASALYCNSCNLSSTTGLQLYLHQGVCYDECPSSTYLNGIICSDCSEDCKECETESTSCTQCESDKKLYQNQCVVSCPAGTTIQVNSQCFDCDNNCQTCTGDIYTCQTCAQSLVLSQERCVSLCPDGYTTTETSNGECQQCNSNCQTCVTTKSTCTSCQSGRILVQNQCLQECPSGFTQTVEDPQQCTACSSACLECDGSITYCTACENGLYLTTSNTCQAQTICPSGTTITDESNGVCVDCISPCEECELEQQNCTSCILGLVLVDSECVACQSPCKTCDGSVSICTSCVQGYYLSGTECFQCDPLCLTCEDSSFKCTACDSGYRLESQTCLLCKDGCATCLDDVNTCTSCQTGLYEQQGSCISCDVTCGSCQGTSDNCTSCVQGRFLTQTNICDPCDPSCVDCQNSSSECTKCLDTQTLINGVCGVCDSQCQACATSFSTCTQCQDGLDLVNGNCGYCSTNCATCVTDFNTCDSCQAGKFLEDGACVGCDPSCVNCQGNPDNCTECVEGYEVIVDGACVPCNEPCETCSTTPDNCDTCQQGKSIIGSTCLTCSTGCSECSGTFDYCLGCYDGWFLQGTECEQCDQACKTCSSNSFNCVTCPEGTDLVGSTCTQDCQEGKTLVGSQCLVCEGHCLTCQGATDYCTSCLSGFLFDGQCLTKCPAGFYFSVDTCYACSSNCYECQTLPDTCLSCNDGYRLENIQCVQICTDGFFYDGANCQQCSSNCATCQIVSTKCLSCKTEEEVVNSTYQCEFPCEQGTTRTSSSGDQCLACATQCQTCAGVQDYCTSCNNTRLVLYQGLCLQDCPAYKTVELNGVCLDCDSNCLTCDQTPYSCESCESGLLLYSQSCVEACPDFYYTDNGQCIACTDPDDCPPTDTDGDQDQDQQEVEPQEQEVNTGQVPFPFTGVTVLSGTVVIVTKLAAVGGVSFVPTVISVWGVTSAISWTFLACGIPVSQEEEGRRLSSMDANSGSLTISICMILILGGLAFHIICNTVFLWVFCKKIFNSDRSFLYWRKQHKHVVRFTLVMVSISFHSIRFFISGLCNKDSFKAEFSNKGKLFKILLRLGYISILCTCVPLLAAQVLLLMELSIQDWIWMFCLDSLIVTLLLVFVLIIDLISMQKYLVRMESDKTMGKDFKKLISAPENSIQHLISKIPYVDFKHFVPVFKVQKAKVKPKSVPNSRCNSPLPSPVLKRTAQRKNSFPLDFANPVQIDPFFLDSYKTKQKKVHQEPQQELGIKQDQTFDQDLTFLDIDCEMILSQLCYKSAITRPVNLTYYPVVIDPRTEQFTQVIAFTQQNSASQQDQLSVEPFQITSFSDMTAPLGIIQQQEELELERAIADSEDPQVLTVPHKQTGQRLKIKKEFKGALIVDPVNKVILGEPPVDSDKFDIPATIVDQSDVRFATLTAYSGQTVRVKRNFRGARILDLEKKVSNSNSHLIGQSVKHQQDFHFDFAYPDPEDPQTVVVTHKPTGEDVKVKKSFHGAIQVDQYGRVMQGKTPINRNDFDIPKTIVDKQDVHIAMLKNKYTNERVRVRRNFRGAKIIDLEKKTHLQKTYTKMYTDRSEPESLGSDTEQFLQNIGWNSPQKVEQEQKKPKMRTQRSKPPKVPLRMKKSKEYDQDPARMRLANLANIISHYEEENRGISDFQDFPMVEPYLPESEEEISTYKPLQFDEMQSPFGGMGERRGRQKKRSTGKAGASPRLQGLGRIYMNSVERKKGGLLLKQVPDLFEPEWEEDEFQG